MGKRAGQVLPREVAEHVQAIEMALTDAIEGESIGDAADRIRTAANAALLSARRQRRTEPPSAEGLSPAEFLGRRVKAQRTDAGWTQEQLGDGMERLGFEWSRNTVAEVERGGRRLSIDELMGLAALFGLPVAEWFRSWPSVELGFADRTIRAGEAFELLTGRAAWDVEPIEPSREWMAARDVAMIRLGDDDWRPVASLEVWTEGL